AANEVPEPYGLKDDPLEAPETGLVYWVKTARRTSDWPEDPLNPKDELPPHEELLPAAYDKANPAQRHKYQEGLHRIFSHVDTFNKDVLRQLPSLQDQWKNNKNALLPPDKGASLPASLVGLDSAYANADTLANLFQSRSQRTLKVLLWLVFAAVIVFAVYAHLLAHAPVDLGPASLEHVDLLALVFYVVILIVADGCYVYVTWRDYQNRHQDYRTLAEGLRVQYYWHLAGLPLSAADHYLTKQKSELDWIRNAIRARGLLAEPGRWEEDSAKECERKERMRLIDRQWIAGQYQYYARASLRGRREDVYWRQAGTGFLVASVMTGFVEAAVVLLRASPAAPRLWYLTIPFILVMLVLIGCHARTRRKEAKENAEQDQEEYEQDQEQIEEKPELKPAKPIPLPPSVSLNAARGLGGGALVSLLCWGLSALLCHFARRPESEKCFPLWGLVETDPKDWLIVAMGVSAAIGALLHYYAQTRAFAEHHQQYKRIKEMFYRVYVRSEQALAQNQSGAAREYMHKLGCEALAEHGDWLLLHRERPMELPKVEVG
ncbi:MAG TPA: hypothetical protein VG013_38220, partial [Gemmataceae bacterium]|nr:hypothetical protein [Gemmataceae bacterium]